MSIQLTLTPSASNKALTEADVTAITEALAPVVALPEGKKWSDVLSIHINPTPAGSKVLNLKFNA